MASAKRARRPKPAGRAKQVKHAGRVAAATRAGAAKRSAPENVATGARARAMFARMLAEFDPAIAGIARAAATSLEASLRGASCFVYDNYNALALGFAPAGKISQAILSVAVYPGVVRLFCLQGAAMPPHPLLEGRGSVVRSLVLGDPRRIEAPEVRELIGLALAHAKVPLDPDAEPLFAIRSVAPVRRPRRKNK